MFLVVFYLENLFLSTLSLRRATILKVYGYGDNKFLSTLSLRRATSIKMELNRTARNFYPRSPCGERLSRASRLRRLSGFLSTLSLRRATTSNPARAFLISYFYPRSPCGERHLNEQDAKRKLLISIHALLAESDT